GAHLGERALELGPAPREQALQEVREPGPRRGLHERLVADEDVRREHARGGVLADGEDDPVRERPRDRPRPGVARRPPGGRGRAARTSASPARAAAPRTAAAVASRSARGSVPRSALAWTTSALVPPVRSSVALPSAVAKPDARSAASSETPGPSERSEASR